MENKEAIQMLARCKGEIISLRKRLAEVEPKADAYDQLRTVIGMLPKQPQGYGEDVVWIIDSEMKKLKDLEADETLEKQK